MSELPKMDPTTLLPVAAEVMKAAVSDPSARPARTELAKAAHTVAKAINVALLPLAAVNYGYDKAKQYFESRFERDLQETMVDVAPENVTEPKASLAGPILQRLAFAHDEYALRTMYLNLLASGMDTSRANAAHPAYVDVISQLTSEEATILCDALAPFDPKPIVQIRLSIPPGAGYLLLYNHLLPLADPATLSPIENDRLPVMVDNWIRLGLVHVDYGQMLTGSTMYDWVRARPEFQRLEALHKPSAHMTFGHGYMRRTAFGADFARVVALSKIPRAIATYPAPASVG
jgi:hypothetical protein